ncbi:MAG: hypothetical protein JWP11_1348 [Frankiales bacterium]|nr:hypothetical protein [Frankiales bacterium]
MTAVNRIAGTAGTFNVVPSAGNTGAPVLTIYSDAARSIVAVAAAACTASGTAGIYLGAYPATLAAGTYYLSFATPYAGGTVADVDDTLVLTTASVSVTVGFATLTDFQTHLNLRSTSNTTAAELQGFLDASVPVIEHITGPINSRTVVEIHDGNQPMIALRRRPLLAVASVTEYTGKTSTALAAAATPAAAIATSYLLDADSGVLWRYGAAGVPIDFGDTVIVQTSVGLTAVPPNVRLASLMQAAHMYQSSQLGGSNRNVNSNGEDGYWMAQAYGIPNRVRELLQPNQRLPGLG